MLPLLRLCAPGCQEGQESCCWEPDAGGSRLALLCGPVVIGCYRQSDGQGALPMMITCIFC